MAWLEDNPPERQQYRPTRRAPERGIVVVHTAENTPDYVAFDGGAEAVARFIQTRNTAGSYHELVDSDSRINLIRDSAEAYGDGTGSNAWAWHLSVATSADVWPWAPQAWRDGAVEQAAQAAAGYAHRLHERTGIVIPAGRISRAESEAGVPGFISHGERDPGRRHDPGEHFPWAPFLARYAQLTADLGQPVSEEDDDMAQVIVWYRSDDGGEHAYRQNGIFGVWVPTLEQVDALKSFGVPEFAPKNTAQPPSMVVLYDGPCRNAARLAG